MRLLTVGFLFVIAGVFLIIAIVTQLFVLIVPYVNPNLNYIILAPYFLIPGGVLMIVLGGYVKGKIRRICLEDEARAQQN